MKSNMIVSKKQFLSNINEWCWVGNGRCDLKTGYACIYEPVCDTYTKWLLEWIVRFNMTNDGFKVGLVVEDETYCIKRIEPDRIQFPKWDDIEDVEYTLTAEEAEDAGEITQESRIDDDE